MPARRWRAGEVGAVLRGRRPRARRPYPDGRERRYVSGAVGWLPRPPGEHCGARISPWLCYLTGQMLPALSLLFMPSGSRKLTWTLSPLLSFERS